MTSPPEDLRPDRHALLELDALLDQVVGLRDAGDRARFDRELHYRLPLYILWIAAGNESLRYVQVARADGRTQPWARLYRQRCRLAHERLSDIDDDAVWRATAVRAEQEYRPAVRAAIW